MTTTKNKGQFETREDTSTVNDLILFTDNTIEVKKLAQLSFKNETLQDAVNLLLDNDFRVYGSRGRSDRDNKVTYVYYEKDEKLAYLQADRFYGVKYSTVHKSVNGSKFGTGFGMLEDAITEVSISELKKGFVFAPNWVKGDLSKITKYKGYKDYLKRPVNRILQSFEIIK